MNFDLLSKKAVSYSSDSIMKILSVPTLAEVEKSFTLPAIRYPTSFPESIKIFAIIAEVVVLP